MARSPRRLERVFGPSLTLKELNVICWGLFFAFLAPAFCRAVQMQNQSGYSIQYSDFVNFYAMGRILNEYPTSDLYDLDLQNRVLNEVHLPRSGTHGPIPYPPFVGIPFRVAARMRYTPAYLLWSAISLALYIGAIILVCSRFFPHDRLRHSLIVCLALSFPPFAIETLVDGQLSTVGLFAIAAAFLLEDSGQFFLGGLALSVCAYKPTLLLLLIPMLFVTRQFKLLIGVFTGLTALVLLTTVMLGRDVWPGYLEMASRFGQSSVGVRTTSHLTLSKYVDLVNFSAILPHGRSWQVLAVLFAAILWAAISLARAWWKAPASGQQAIRLAWAATLTWTLLLNAYVPIYDSILVVLSVLITAGVLTGAHQETSRRVLGFLWPLIFAVSWFTIRLVDSWHLQLLTIFLAALGIMQLSILGKTIRDVPQASK
jgi:hypothetical protein